MIGIYTDWVIGTLNHEYRGVKFKGTVITFYLLYLNKNNPVKKDICNLLYRNLMTNEFMEGICDEID